MKDISKCTCSLKSDKLYMHYPDCPYRKYKESIIKKGDK